MINFDRYFKVGALALGLCLCGGMDAFATQPVVSNVVHQQERGEPGENIGSAIINGQKYVEREVSGNGRNQCPFHAMNLSDRESAYVDHDSVNHSNSRAMLIVQILDAWEHDAALATMLRQDLKPGMGIEAYLNRVLNGDMAEMGLDVYENRGLFDAMAYVQGRRVTIISNSHISNTFQPGSVIHHPHPAANGLPDMYVMFNGNHFTALDVDDGQQRYPGSPFGR